MICTNHGCSDVATKIMAWPMVNGRAMYVAPYCDEHAEDAFNEQNAVPAAGPALSEEAREIEGIRS